MLNVTIKITTNPLGLDARKKWRAFTGWFHSFDKLGRARSKSVSLFMKYFLQKKKPTIDFNSLGKI